VSNSLFRGDWWGDEVAEPVAVDDRRGGGGTALVIRAGRMLS
jgi:hypothetical protein